MRSKIIKEMNQRFGIDKKYFKEFSFIKRSNKIWIVSKDVLEKNLTKLKIETVGILFGRYFKKQAKFKPTTNALQIFGKHATKNIVSLSKNEGKRYINGYDIEKELNIENGYVIVKYKRSVLGCGLYKDGFLKNQIPKSKRGVE